MQDDSKCTELIFLKMDQQRLLKPSCEHIQSHELGCKVQGITFRAMSLPPVLLGAWLAEAGDNSGCCWPGKCAH